MKETPEEPLPGNEFDRHPAGRVAQVKGAPRGVR